MYGWFSRNETELTLKLLLSVSLVWLLFNCPKWFLPCCWKKHVHVVWLENPARFPWVLFRISRSYTFGVRGDPASVTRGGLQINRRGCLEQVPDLFCSIIFSLYLSFLLRSILFKSWYLLFSLTGRETQKVHLKHSLDRLFIKPPLEIFMS